MGLTNPCLTLSQSRWQFNWFLKCSILCVSRWAPAAPFPRPDTRSSSCSSLLGWKTLRGQLPAHTYPVTPWQDLYLGPEVIMSCVVLYANRLNKHVRQLKGGESTHSDVIECCIFAQQKLNLLLSPAWWEMGSSVYCLYHMNPAHHLPF